MHVNLCELCIVYLFGFRLPFGLKILALLMLVGVHLHINKGGGRNMLFNDQRKRTTKQRGGEVKGMNMQINT